ncbi:hypothetical protein HQ308_20015 [Rhodococcus sp. BP-241]|uniref:hypothetical protein n=1 Tax=Rhodococcus sp. BP-241 TaxID=2739441 RepID=UPI001C9BA254|nr:hypothetical protein [Rhodococcus sp. BP-241]MBY6709079.1 hypothetical protein [Rhodococcus sp. BP-241]
MTKHFPTPLPPQWFDTTDQPADERSGGHVVPPCQRDPASWDVDQSTAAALGVSATRCVTLCPVIGACRARVDELRSRSARSGVGVRELAGMVWAGHVYDRDGVRVDLASAGLRVGPVAHHDSRHVTADGRIFDGHTGRWVPGLAPADTRHS